MSRITLKTIFLLISFFFFLNSNAQYVSTFAGSAAGFADGAGTAAQFYWPNGMAVDAAGNLYVTDNNRIRKITTAGVVSTFAGGSYGSVDGIGTAAQFNDPYDVAVDAAGNVYVADTHNHRIRKITANGVTITFAGSGIQGVADGSATVAQFRNPSGIAVDSDGNVFVVDQGSFRIRKITAAGVVSTLAGSTPGYADGIGIGAQFNYPNGVAVDASGNVYVADSQNNRIRKINALGVVTTFAGSTQGSADGIGTAAQFYVPRGVALDAAGNIFVTDSNNHRIRKITPGGMVSTLAGSTQGFADGTGTAAQFNLPCGVAIDAAGTIFVADAFNNRIRKITPALGTANFHQNQVSVYPNPATTIINVELEDVGGAKVRIFDMNGRALQSENIIDSSSAINISGLENGVYLMEISTDRGTVCKKIVKQ